MNEADIKTIDELTEFMTAEAALWGRTDSEQKTVNGEGIRKQWDDRDKFPYPVFYLRYNTVEGESKNTDGSRRVQFDLKSMWFDEEGNVTDKPSGNAAPLYIND